MTRPDATFNLALLVGVGFWSMNLVGHSQPARGR